MLLSSHTAGTFREHATGENHLHHRTSLLVRKKRLFSVMSSGMVATDSLI